MKRYQRKLGDVFRYEFDGKCRYLQYIGNDNLQLEGDVVRIFSGTFPVNKIMTIDEIIVQPVDFHCITYVINCVKFGKWKKCGNSTEIGNLENIKFRCASDYGNLLNGEPIKTSNDWYVWTYGDQSTTSLGPLTGQWKSADIGGLLPPAYINERMEIGKYNFIYPEPA